MTLAGLPAATEAGLACGLLISVSQLAVATSSTAELAAGRPVAPAYATDSGPDTLSTTGMLNDPLAAVLPVATWTALPPLVTLTATDAPATGSELAASLVSEPVTVTVWP